MRNRISRPVLALVCTAALAPLRALATDAFDFSSYERVPLVLTLQTPDGSPLAHARVTIADRWVRRSRVHTQGRTFLTALSDEQGQVDTQVQVPRGTRLVDVIVSLPGYRGPYTLSQLRRAWGPFAPAARVTRPIAKLAALTLTFAPTR